MCRAKKRILDVEQFNLRYGEVMALIGPNGAGKSTLLQVLALLQKPDSGELLLHGEQVTKNNNLSLRRRMAVVFQEPLLLDTTVYNNVASGLLIRGHKREEAGHRIKKWLDYLGIGRLAQRHTRFLSGGESQRVSLARALAMEPELLFLDEPFSSLDFPTRRSLIRDLSGILKSTAISTLLVTHDYTEIPLLAQSIAVMQEGRIVQHGNTGEVFAKPCSEEVATLLGVLEEPLFNASGASPVNI